MNFQKILISLRDECASGTYIAVKKESHIHFTWNHTGIHQSSLPSVALETFLEEVKLEFAENQFKKPNPNLTPGEQQALKQLIVTWQRHYTQRDRQGNNICHNEQRK